ncbi:MAG: hypothetical protein M3Z20_19250 [Chloroflexota bacterium]|nr:hypothetical protein [Chloroflexota bacterium]
MKMHVSVVAWGLAAGLALLTGCAAQAHRVSCDERLEPINTPAPNAVPVPLSPPEPLPATAEAP